MTQSNFVSVRVRKSKRKEYRTAIKNFVEEKFASESSSREKVSKITVDKKYLDGFLKFEEFVKKIKQQDKTEKND